MSKISLDRRALLGACAMSAAAGGLFGLVPTREAAARWAPRPPGALEGARFTAACARCGQCVAACPYDALKLSAWGDPAPLGTPYFVPREIPCYLCKDLPCVKACPTGALDPALEDAADSRMGMAVVDPASCLSFQGLRCEVCVRECPETGKALTLEMQPRGLSAHTVFMPVVHPDKCTGCGICEKACPTDEAAIRIVDAKSVLGRIGKHYRLGWLEEDDPKNRREAAPAAPAPAPEPEAAGGLDYLNENLL